MTEKKKRNLNPGKVLEMICKNLSAFVSQQAGGQAGKAGAAVLYPQAVFLLGPLEPVILWTGAQQKGRVGEGRSGEPRAWRAVSLHWRRK